MLKRYQKVIGLFLLVEVFNQLIRLLFFSANRNQFSQVNGFEYLRLMFHSLRFDLSVLLTINILVIAILMLPVKVVSKKIIQSILLIVFIGSNLFVFLFDLADIGYYPYVRKRMTWDVFDLIGRKSDFVNLLPSYAIRFWYVFVFIILLFGLFIYSARRIWRITESQQLKSSFKSWLIWLGFLLVGIIGIRGGLQLKPILINNALLVASNEHAPLVYSSAFSILHSIEETNLHEIAWVDPPIVDSLFNPNKTMGSPSTFQKKNVVVLVLESFGKLYTGLGGRTSYTPFLDSLCNHSLYCSKAYANASTSAMGIPAVLAGIPAFYNEAFTTSPYGRNKIDAIGNLLLQQGYHTSFFHGGTNGTMNFHVFAKNAGFETYFGRNEYPNQNDYDGTWGIYDDKFLSFFADKLNHEKQPFASTVFTLSSHEPFALPKDHPKFLDSLQDIRKGIAYTDYALRLFFEKVKQQSWYSNTLFVITADHAYMACHDDAWYYNQGLGLFSIPIIYFDPGNPKLNGNYSKYTQQIDILPSIMDYLKYPTSFFAFGNSIFSNQEPFVWNTLNGQDVFEFQNKLLVTNQSGITGIFDLTIDSNLTHRTNQDTSSMILHYKSFKQQLVNRLIENRMSVSSQK